MVTTSSLSAQQKLHKLATLLCSAVTPEGNPLQSIVSQLPAFISQDYCGRSSFPTLILHNKRKHGGIQLPGNIGLKDTAILNLALPFYCSIGEIEAAPMIMLQNLSQSFSSLIGSRLRSCVIALMTQTINGVKGYHHRTGQNEELLRLLHSNPINITAVVTTFRALAVADGSNENIITAQVALPLVFEAILDMNILGETNTVKLRCSGSIAAFFDEAEEAFRDLDVVLNTAILLQSMMKEARVVVRKAVVMATTLAAARLSNSEPSLGSTYQRSLGSNRYCGSHLNLSMPPPPPRKPSSRNLRNISSSAESLPTDKDKSQDTRDNEPDSDRKDSNIGAEGLLSLKTLRRSVGPIKKRKNVETDERCQDLMKKKSSSWPTL